MKNTIPVLAAALLLGAGRVFAEDYDARLTALGGAVEVRAGGGKDWREAEDEMPLSAGDHVRTGENSSAEITLDDGGVVRLNADTSMEIASADSESASLSLRLGSLVSKIRSGFLKNKRRFEIRTPSAVCAVRGTEFGVEHNEESGETTAGVFDEGELSVSSLDEGGQVVSEGTVEKGNEVRLRRGERGFKPGAMRRLLRHRKALETARGRLTRLQKTWKRLSPEKRQELRGRFMARKAVAGKLREKRGARPGRQRRAVRRKKTGQ